MGSRYYSKRIFKKRPKLGLKAPEKPKSFKTEEAAQKWAKTNGLKTFRVETIGKESNKFKIRVRF